LQIDEITLFLFANLLKFLLFKIMKRILIIVFLGIIHNFCSAQELKKVTPNYS